MTDADTPIDLDGFDAEVVALAEAQIAEGQPALINALGVRLGARLRKVRLQTGLGFQDYLRSRLADRYDIIPVKENTPGLWPKGRDYEAAVSALRQKPKRPRAARWQTWFWKAFTDPLEDQRRFIDLTGRQVRDANEGEADWREVPQAMIRDRDQSLSVADVHRRIGEWLEQTGLEAEAFIDQTVPVSASSGGRSVLDLLIGSLSTRQLQSVSLPLDVVAELAKRQA